MPKLLFYRQKRYDQAVRTGIELDEEEIAEEFVEGSPDHDSVLLWYVDLRCEGDGIPDDPDDAIQWLIDQSPVIRSGFQRFEVHLRAGSDPDIYALHWSDFPDAPSGVKLEIACSAARRIDARDMATILRELSGNWLDIIGRLQVPQEAKDLR